MTVAQQLLAGSNTTALACFGRLVLLLFEPNKTCYYVLIVNIDNYEERYYPSVSCCHDSMRTAY